ncbi:SAM-dependent methyltransferase [Bythopirellula polymerisocia]|uniref:Cyclopropane mycolic acid synthase MmaA2 n=1 Tax=Bythopirellula polymerisocia TaxID=2528003 RepID=A0A5C6CI17_9BACT|nr:class I SAM-dependent methyltransferase [Bythopirellula polymerisocia]TWU23715.1 Cyclopropane mycolic acid synthase MmaA2 [Bythopirellula polymerisocia]
MNFLARKFLNVFEAIPYGVSYAWLNDKIRSPEPLNEEAIWQEITGPLPPAVQFVRDHWPLRPLRWALLATKMKQDHLLGISEHYDVSNEFYELFLDKKYMFYTCADFNREGETIEDAQQNKADYILRLIDPQPGEKILELGCGWGAMLKRLYEHTGEKENLYGLTLSQEQVVYNQQHNGFNVSFDNFITRDYQPNEFDVIYSIGSFEHVRPKEIAPLSKKIYDALKPGGRAVHHFFCRVPPNLFATAICSQIYFPGSIGSTYNEWLHAFEGAGFRISHRSIHDYRPTLRAWFDNLVANRERALQLVDVQTYNRYVTFFPSSYRYFNDGNGMLIRWVMHKPK